MTFAKYQLTEALPYWCKRYLLFQRSATLRPLYTTDHQGRVDTKKVADEIDRVSQ